MGDPDTLGALRHLPAVGALLSAPEVAPLIERHGRALVTDAARNVLESTRDLIRSSGKPAAVTAADVARAVEALTQRSLRRVINATGVILHTNLGRAPIAAAAEAAIHEVARGYSTLEMDIDLGERGDRHRHISELVTQLVASEDALVFNNNAGAVLVMLAALCRGREVIVARGQLVEIGGGFRVPDVMKESGCTLVEIGTTNKVYVRDYEAAITDKTAAILEVHRSNFAIVGFVAEPTTRELAELAKKRSVPMLVDLGSGLLAGEKELGDSYTEVRTEPRPQELFRAGADVVAFSGDKLLGGPQAGIIAGRVGLLEKVRRHPLARALRADKLTLAALEATLRLYRDEKTDEIPVIRMLRATPAELRARAERIQQEITRASNVATELKDGEAVPGGGSLPLARLPTTLVLVGPAGEGGRKLEEALRAGATPIVTRVVEDRVAIDVRTILEDEEKMLGPLIATAWARVKGSKEKIR